MPSPAPPPPRPVIGITLDNLDNTRGSGRYDLGVGYSAAVAAGGGVPIALPHELNRVANYVALCDGFVFTGGVDPDTTAFGQPVHPKARLMGPGATGVRAGAVRRDRGGQAAGGGSGRVPGHATDGLARGRST